MSIPPLVCSTPPPPDQCEEDKDPDDFDIPYSLSQDEDEDDFGYGDFSTFNHYQSNCIARKKDTVSETEVHISNHEAKEMIVVNNLSESRERNPVLGTNTTSENKSKSDEDTHIEDLGLKVNEESTSCTVKEDDQGEESSNIEVSEGIPGTSDDATDNKYTTSSSSSEENVAVLPSGAIEVESLSINHCKEYLDDRPIDDPPDLEPSNEQRSMLNYQICENYVSPEAITEPVKDPNVDDEFGEFEDFQFVSSERKGSGIVEDCENPWETNENNNDDSFGNFTANFESNDSSDLTVTINENVENNDQIDPTLKTACVDEYDDFGDFDDFKSSSVEKEAVETGDSEQDRPLPVLNFQGSDSEHQVIESITKVLCSIFEEELLEPEVEFEGRLESMLSESWRHLQETDVRQPYIINWNNSLGQKTLLKALCIDSRNILFGPKWGYNTPKYAVNLSAAPLQPQKPLTSLNSSQSEPIPPEKPTTNAGGWTDPFTADGKEFTYAEALLLDLEHLMATLDQMAHNHSTLKISELLSHACNTDSDSVVEVTSSDLDVFEAAVSSKPDSKIYSSTLNVQPLRQINLPDTHIFTPTDSEIPTSKTVHYDSGAPILLPQTSLASGNVTGSSTIPNANYTPKDNKEDDDYWEFQDFRSNIEKSSTNTASSASQIQTPPDVPENTSSKSNVTYQTQVLQPIRMEPQMPTVNWPDPGQIKETFDDFSDFVSNSTWSDNLNERISTPQIENQAIPETDVLDKINTKHKNAPIEKDNPKVINKEDFDDDFDTFQSALPTKRTISGLNIPSQNVNQIPDFNNAFPKTTSEIISINNLARPNEALTPNEFNTDTKTLNSNKTSISIGNQMIPGLLQPVPTSLNAITSQTKPKAGQILQPLSLESYSQINWPNPGIDLQDLSRFNPVETLPSLKSDLNTGSSSKVSSPVHNQKSAGNSQVGDDDWGEFVSSKPKQQAPSQKNPPSFVDDDEWTDFVSSPTVKPLNGLNTISLNVHTNSNIQKTSNHKFPTKSNQLPLDIPTLNYITPKATGHSSYNDRHFQNL